MYSPVDDSHGAILQVEEVVAGDSSGQDTLGTQTIAELRRAFGGRDEGYVGSPFGSKHRLSLQPWAGQDPERTRLAFSFT